MDSISMYDELKKKHNRQEEFLKDTVTEKLTSVDIGNADVFDLDKEVRVDGQAQAVTAKSVFMSVYSKEYVDRLSEVDAKQITEDANLQKVARLSVKTRDTKANAKRIHEYSTNNTERNEKTRNKHREKVHHHAKQIILSSGIHRKAISKCDELVGKEELTAAEKKTLKQEFLKKYKLDLEVIEQEYQMNKNLLLMGGKKDIAEEDSLFRLRYTRYAKAIAANKKGIEMAEKYPELFDAATFQKQIDKINKKLSALVETVSPALMESKKRYFTESTERRAQKIKAKEKAAQELREIAKIKEKHGERIQRAIDRFIEKKSENATEAEVAWLRENLSFDIVLAALRKGVVGNNMLLADTYAPGFGDAFFNNLDLSMSMFMERYLFSIATKIPKEVEEQLTMGGIKEEDLDRSVRSQLHPVRKLKNGNFATAQDEINDAFNRKYIRGLLENDMEARRECINENLETMYSYRFDMVNFEIEDFYETNTWEKLKLIRIALCVSNLINDEFAAGGTIQNNKEVAKQLLEHYEHGSVEVDGYQMDYATFVGQLVALYNFLGVHKYNLDMGTGELANDMLGNAPGALDAMTASLKAFVEKYSALQNNAGGQQ